MTRDAVLKYVVETSRVLVAFGDEILDAVQESKQIDVRELREKLLGQLRRYCESHSGDA